MDFTKLQQTLFEIEPTDPREDLAKLNRELDNPLAKYWSLVFQENLSINNGNIVEGNLVSNTLFLQPALPIPFGNNLVFTARPVFPLVTQPNFSQDPSGSKSVTGFGDVQMAALIGPGNASGWVWGFGTTFVFPTASNQNLGAGKIEELKSFPAQAIYFNIILF